MVTGSVVERRQPGLRDDISRPDDESLLASSGTPNSLPPAENRDHILNNKPQRSQVPQGRSHQ
jgi:hypothetical protein